jgi:hypothetical protein
MPGPRVPAIHPFVVAGLSVAVTAVLLLGANAPVHW